MDYKLDIILENCFGIGKLDHKFTFSDHQKAQLIYAPNGTMKSSFAKVFNLISQGKKDEIKDRIFINKQSSFKINFKNLELDKNIPLVIDADTKLSDVSITKFIASKELKNRYDQIYIELIEVKESFLSSLKRQSRSSDCENELKSVFLANETIFEYLLRIEQDLSKEHKEYNFKYNDIFDKGDKVKKFLEANRSLLDDYLQRYMRLLKESKFFNKSLNSFGTIQAASLLSSLSDNSFFDAGHIINLKSQELIKSKIELELLIKNEMDQILNDIELVKKFDKVDKALGKNAELKAFKSLIESDRNLLGELIDFNGFRDKIWKSHIASIGTEANIVIELYKSRKIELEEIISNAKGELSEWEKTINLFNSRFYVPFEISLENQSDIILKSDVPKLIFNYKGEVIPDNNENTLLDILSRGESRAYFILRFLFEIEARIKEDGDLLIIFDDVADSFDYKNKYAIIEYIKDLLNTANVYLIILTHHFDFYRTIASRLNIKQNSFFATKCNKNIVKIQKGRYFEDVFNNIFIKNYDKEKYFIGLIPFIRNLHEYLSDEESFKLLTNCLHIREDSRNITVQKIHDCFIKIIKSQVSVTLSFANKSIISMIFEQADQILLTLSDHSADIEDKLVLAIACRLKAENYMISQLTSSEDIRNISNINKNQTQELYKLCKKKGIHDSKLKILDKVNLMTPEHIHLNSFMFEPLVDMSMNHLSSLFKELDCIHIELS